MNNLITLSFHLRLPGSPKSNSICQLIALLLAAAFVFSISGFADASPANAILYDTGQTKCYQTDTPYNQIPCYSTGQDGEYTFAPLSYAADSLTVTDKNTGLLWQRQNDLVTRSWSAAGSYCDNLNSLNFDGYNTGWRLPTNQELMGLADYSLGDPGPPVQPALNATYFPISASQSQLAYWTSTPVAGDNTSAWYVDFSNGSNGYDLKATSNLYFVRCVHGTEPSYGSFINNGNSTITDPATSLMWQQGHVSSEDLADALTHCENLDFASRQNWRLPNIRELISIVDYSRAPALNSNYFSYNPSESITYRSSTTENVATANSWWVYIPDGKVDADPKSNQYWVKCVTCANLPVWIYGTSSYYSTVQAGYNNITSGYTLALQSQPFTENLNLTSLTIVAINLTGGYSCDYYASNNGFSTIHGSVTIGANTSVTVDKLIIQ
ncbi:MAG TPA: DUF1566 domain-containing protein [Dissulfurispiraceae bacterium]|nr:DUF1566 domain-containing protein [Dissulfurispiraceae bacterium]